MAWLVGVPVAAATMWAARRQMRRVFDETQREIHESGRGHGHPLSTDPSGDPDTPRVGIFVLPADSPEAVRMAKAMRRLKVSGMAFFFASIVVPIVLLVVTAWWAVLKLAG